ncbi:MAG: iron-sulfur cluster assembly protein [Motilibacteraceae bacterium]
MSAATIAEPTALEAAARRALDAVIDPELDEPITALGFVRSLEVRGHDAGVDDRFDVLVHLRLPTSFCSPNFAYLMASDAKDALSGLSGVGTVVVELDDHHDSDLINRGLAADAGYLGTFGHEAEKSLDELRLTFRRKAHTAAMERALTALLRADPELREEELHGVTLADLPDVATTHALLRRRQALGLPVDGGQPVLVDDTGQPYPPEQVPLRLRMARSVRISIDGNAHFCRGLLRTRYPESAQDQSPCGHGDTDATDVVDVIPGAATAGHALLPLEVTSA